MFLAAFSFNHTAFCENLLKHYQLPPVQRVPETDAAYNIIQHSLALKRTSKLPVLGEVVNLREFRTKLTTTLEDNIPKWPETSNILTFTGSSFSELNQFLATHQGTDIGIVIKFASPEIVADTTLAVSSSIFLDGTGVTVKGRLQAPAIVLDKDTIFSGLRGFEFDNVFWPISIKGAKKIILTHLTLTQPTWGITVFSKSRFIGIDQSTIDTPQNTGLLVQGDVTYLRISNNEITNGMAANNGSAAILLTDSTAPKGSPPEAFTNNAALAQPIWPPANVPHQILITQNNLHHNRAQGIYLDGANGNLIEDNTIVMNDKEGMCLDFGSALNLVIDNKVSGNGNRARQTDEDLQIDLVSGFGRLPDGSAVAKLPGISLDNAVYNLIMSNIIKNNAGDGVKSVRSSHRNYILFNSIIDNNKGHNDRFQFFGVLLGSANAEPQVAKNPQHSLNFSPSLENVIAGNIIYGAHRAGILLDRDAAYNDIYDNIVRLYRVAPLESASQAFNNIYDNSWNLAPSN